MSSFHTKYLRITVGLTDVPRTLDGSEPQRFASKNSEIAAKIDSSDKKIKKAICVLLDIEQ